MDLVIVESPTKAKALHGFLGRGYNVVASMGHICDLPPKQLGVDIEHGFQPTYQLRKGAGKVIRKIKDYAVEADAIYLATDPDREGEAIAWHILRLVKVRNKPVYRVTFHEITSQAVKSAIATPGQLNMNLVNAQQARRVLDRLVGYQVSPVLWKAIKGRKALSAGRVQTVALRLIVERDREIAAFVPEEYWTLEAELSKIDDERRFRALLVRIGRDKADLKTREDCLSVIAALEGASFYVLKVKQEQKSRRPYPPYTTSTLQQDAASRLGWGAEKTMRIAQQLYEGVELPEEGTVGLITYMRTDSTFVAETAQAEARQIILSLWGEEYLPEAPPVYKTRARVAQEAHEAIRPTSSGRLPDRLRGHLTPDQARLYELIWRRFIASQMKPAVYHVTTVDVATSRDGMALPYMFRAGGRELLFEGFLKAYRVEIEEGTAEQILPPLADGEPLRLHGLFPEQHFTKPPPHFTEAGLIKELERLGIGRPSTYATIIHTIVARDYVRREQKSLLATELGMAVCDFLIQQFPDLFAVGFTARMEDELDCIARGERPWVTVLGEFYAPFAAAVERATRMAQTSPVSLPAREVTPAEERCPVCGGNVVIREGRYGRFRSCASFPRCKWSAPLAVGRCPECGAELVERKGKRGVFWGCSRYPDCRHVESPRPPEK